MIKQTVLIVDYGMGNLHSVKKKLVALGVNVIVSSSPDNVSKADKLILPGVGHFGRAMENLRSRNLIDPLNSAVVSNKKPILGICLGMQLMSNKSEEGTSQGLGWINAEVVKFKLNDSKRFKVPHVGWNSVTALKDSRMTDSISDDAEFYFVHSYHVKSNDQGDILHKTSYEYEFVSAFEKDNIFGVQYHPEKSHDVGERLLKNFIDI